MRLFYWLVICSCLLGITTSFASAQMRIDSYVAVFSGLQIVDTAINVRSYQTRRGPSVYTYQSNDSGYSIVFGDTIARIDEVKSPFIEPDGTIIDRQYQKEISFVVDTSVNQLRNVYFYSGFSADSEGWYSNETFTLDSIDIQPTPNGYHSFIKNLQLIKANLDFHRYKGNISPNIPGWIAHLDPDFLGNGSFEITINGSLPLAVKKVKSDDEITIVPNPAFGIVTISVPKQQTRIQLYDMLGREIQVHPLGADDILRFNSASLACGIYCVRCGALVEKLIVSAR